jgi:NAD(P)-dependent dehydrogenase (short-subunit alcohol dehydrogenase family)
MTIPSRFGARSTAADVVTGLDLSGKAALVTGAASGIGIETARALAQAGAETILAVRDSPKGESVADELRRATGNARILALPLDLSAFASIRQLARAVAGRLGKLDILVNNAGVMAAPFEHTAEGFELQFGTNHVGHFLLTTLLVPLLSAAGRARVVSVSSSAHRFSDVVWDDIGFEHRPYEPMLAYAQSKTANVLFAVELTRRFATQGIFANALHPGSIPTALQRHVPPEVLAARRAAAGVANQSFKSTGQGAATSVWAAVAPELEGVGGLFLEDCREAEPLTPETLRTFQVPGYAPYARSPEGARRLWTVTEQLVAAHPAD